MELLYSADFTAKAAVAAWAEFFAVLFQGFALQDIDEAAVKNPEGIVLNQSTDGGRNDSTYDRRQ